MNRDKWTVWNAIKQFVYVNVYKGQPTFRQTAIVNNNFVYVCVYYTRKQHFKVKENRIQTLSDHFNARDISIYEYLGAIKQLTDFVSVVTMPS